MQTLQPLLFLKGDGNIPYNLIPCAAYTPRCCANDVVAEVEDYLRSSWLAGLWPYSHFREDALFTETNTPAIRNQVSLNAITSIELPRTPLICICINCGDTSCFGGPTATARTKQLLFLAPRGVLIAHLDEVRTCAFG